MGLESGDVEVNEDFTSILEAVSEYRDSYESSYKDIYAIFNAIDDYAEFDYDEDQ